MYLCRYSILIIILNLNFSFGFNVLGLFPHPGKSHFAVYKPLLVELANRGHNVTIMSFFPLDYPTANYTDVSLKGLTDIHQERISLSEYESSKYGLYPYIREAEALIPIDKFALSICNKLYGWPTVQKLISDNVRYDVVLVEGFNSECILPFAYHHGVPVITMISSPMIHWTADNFGVPEDPSFIPTLGVTFADNFSLWQRFRNTLLLYSYKIWQIYAIRRQEEAILKKLFHKDIDLKALAKNSSLLLMNTHHSLNGARAQPPGVIEVGGMHLNKTNVELPSEMADFINNSTEGIVVFSFGSLIRASSMSQRIRKIFIKVFSKFPIKIIWKWDTGVIEGAGDNILVAKWIPQYDLLRHSKVVAFIGHGGLLGTTEAIDAGKPIMIIPFFGDQPTNAAKAVKAGLAVLLEYCEITETSLTIAMEKLLSESLRVSAQRLSRVWHDRPMEPLDEAVYWTERMARLGHDDQLIPASRQLPFYKTAMLDVIALGVVIIMNLVIIFVIASKLMLKSLLLISPFFKGFAQTKTKMIKIV